MANYLEKLWNRPDFCTVDIKEIVDAVIADIQESYGLSMSEIGIDPDVITHINNTVNNAITNNYDFLDED